MEPSTETDHIALLALMISGVLIKRLSETGGLDAPTAKHLHKLVEGVRNHAKNRNLSDLNILFDNIEKPLGELATGGAG